MSYGSIQKINDIDFFIETYTSGHTIIAIVIENDHGDIKNSHDLIDGKLEEIFNNEEIKEIKNSDDSHKTMAALYYEYNKESLDDTQKLINISKALTTFKESHGKNWKSKLSDMFSNGFDHAITNFEKIYLKQFRNKYLEVLPKITNSLGGAAIFTLVKDEDDKQLFERLNANKGFTMVLGIEDSSNLIEITDESSVSLSSHLTVGILRDAISMLSSEEITKINVELRSNE